MMDELKAGRELDALVAVKVMGWTDIYAELGIGPETPPNHHTRLPHYSTNIADAWKVAEKCRITITPDLPKWQAAYCNWGQGGEISAVGTTNYREWSLADTAPHAICLAALQCVK